MIFAEIATHVKFATLSLLLFTSAKFFLASRSSQRSLAAAIFTLTLAGYIGCQLTHHLPLEFWLSRLVHVACFAVPVAFLLLTESLFSDKFRFRWRHLAMFLFIETVNFTLIDAIRIYTPAAEATFGDSVKLMRALPQMVSLIFILTALTRILLQRRVDLDERRRKFRLKFISITSIYILLVLVSEMTYQEKHPPMWIEFGHAMGMLATVFYFTVKIFAIAPGTLGETASALKPKETAEKQGEADPKLLEALTRAIEVDKVYTAEALSIRQLAAHLGTQEYLLRRLINQSLGYRNFNDYLNEIRIKEAARILSDIAQADLAIIRIAMDLGFGSLAPFNRAFKERMQMTPTEYRKKYQSFSK